MKKSVLKVRQLSVSYTHLLDNKNKNSLEGVTAVSVFSSSLNGARAVIVFHRVQLYPHATSVPVTRCTVSTRDLQVLVAIIKKKCSEIQKWADYRSKSFTQLCASAT